jgi:hypothetical protein
MVSNLVCRFAYQKLNGWRPILRPREAEIFFFIAGSIMLALGVPILVASLRVKEYSARYDNIGPFAGLSSQQQQQALWSAPDAGIVYSFNIYVEEDMEPPIYVVYELGSFRQNYRRYVRSYDAKQMHDGGNLPGASACQPYQYEGDGVNSSLPYDGAVLPCGQISHSYFNDSFTVLINGNQEAIDDSSIAWPSDANHLYGDVQAINYNLLPSYRGGNTTFQPLNQAQHWMVWQRVGGQVPVQKLYGNLGNTRIPAGTNVTITVNNRYNTYAFEGVKKFILTTNSWVGGRNLMLPITYLVVSGLSYFFVILFFVSYDLNFIWKRQPGLEEDFSWNR